MTGGLKKTTSRLAIATIASVVASGAFAADLGGNCCADLEERVAELEATTARKGNRKVKLTVSGHVNEAVIFWDDGVESNTYVVSNNNSRSRFRFVGDAKINSEWSAGYLMEIGVRYANSGNRSQIAAGSGGNSNSLDIRHSAWWLERKDLGRVWVGHTSMAADGITEINLANINSTSNDHSGNIGGFFLRNANGVLSNVTYGGVHSGSNFNVGEGDRNNTIKYVSPTLHGFTFSTAWGEDDKWDVALRYAGEFNGVRVAGGVGYTQISTNVGAGDGGCANAPISLTESTVDCSLFGLSGSVMHVPTGLYVMGSYGFLDDNNRTILAATAKDKDEHWYIQAGLERNHFGIGLTTIYGEYGVYQSGMTISGGARNASGTLNGGLGFISDAEVTKWGVGINQQISAAAMDVYLAYTHYSTNVNTSFNGGQVGKVGAPVQDFDALMMGAIIRF